MQDFEQMRRVLKIWLRRVRKTIIQVVSSLSVLRSWEQLTRAAALGAIGLSMLASGESVNPWSIGLGAFFLVLNVFIAYAVGQRSEEK